jgi:hypothetical protein
MRRVAQVGAVVGIGATVVAAYALYQLLHFETCFSNDVVGKAVECTKHVVGDGYLLAGAMVAVVIGMFVASSMFRLLFPLFWLIMGTGALLAALTSSTTISPGVDGAPSGVAHLPNVSRTVGFEIGGMFVAIGIILYVVFWAVGLASGGLRRVIDSAEQGEQPSTGGPGLGLGGGLGALEQAAIGRIEQAAMARMQQEQQAAAAMMQQPPATPTTGIPPAAPAPAPGVAPTGSPPVGLTPELRAAMLASARNALAAVQDPAMRKLLIDQYRLAGIPIDEAGNPTT